MFDLVILYSIKSPEIGTHRVQGSGFDPKQSTWPATQQGLTQWSESEVFQSRVD
ncbi:MAG TPA: hypothetical protein PLB18_10805 [Acidobacteriota bacterium]|nr:hypothetical protein [Acidobacteriota bacterium]HNC45918.1 hypothetical protein [Acidobacteriota bacterium]HND19856.1 hypothetical protein [Acidobacteriota bacterium]HNG93356.1 hypothetical protein [Acidobacteriota bacterium]HNJ40872.1 hypothetical protein [Acidobacteriota bacterium]